MNRHNWITISVVVGELFLFSVTAPLLAAASDINGKVVEVNGSRVKIEYESQYAPNVGDPVEIGFKLGDDFIRVEGEWKIVEVGSQFVWVHAKGAGAGIPAVDYLAIIHSENPLLRTAIIKEKNIFTSEEKIDTEEKTAQTDKDKIPAKGDKKPKSLEEQLASFTNTAVKNNFSTLGESVSCESGRVRIHPDKIEMTASGGEKNDFCTLRMSDDVLEDFYAAVKISVDTTSHYDFMVGIIYGSKIEDRIKPDSIIAVTALMSMKASKGQRLFLPWVSAYRRSNQGKSHATIVEKFLPYTESNPTPGILAFLKTDQKCRIFWNGEEMGSWEEPIILKGYLWLAFTPVTKGKATATFEDIRVYRLH